MGGEVANGEIFDETSQVNLPAHCNSLSLNKPRIQIYASDTHMHSVEPLTSFTADWLVPALPRQDYGQTVYFWPGFKSQQPEMGWPASACSSVWTRLQGLGFAILVC